jgi:hypothetical protein
MHATGTIRTDGPYLHVQLPDVIPPDWDALRHELEPEIDEGVTRVTFVLGQHAGVKPDDQELLALVGSLRTTGVRAVVRA